MIFGSKINKLYKKSFYHSRVFFIEENHRFLQWISLKKTLYNSRIDLLNIHLVFENNKIPKTFLNTDDILFILYSNEKGRKRKITLKFCDFSQKNLFWQGLLHFMSEARVSNEFRPHIDMLASTFIGSNNEKEKVMNLKKLKRFLKDRQILVEEEEIKKILSKIHGKEKINAEENFVLNKENLRKILKELLNCNEFIAIFANYCENWMKMDENSSYFLSLKELRKFFRVEQNQVFENDEDLMEVIRTYEEKSQEFNNEKKIDKISLAGFRNILFSINNQIFDVNKLAVYQVFIEFF